MKMSLSNISSGVEKQPVLALIFAPEGVGKTTFGADAPGTVFMDVEGGSHFLNTKRFPKPDKLQDVYDGIEQLMTQPHDYKTLVVDTVDELERLVWEHCCTRDGKSSIEDYGFGRGYKEAQKEWVTLRNKLTDLQLATRMNIVLLGHAAVKTSKDPQMVDHDQFILRVHGSSASILKEWVNAVGFANHEAIIVQKDKDDKSTNKVLSYTGKRKLYFQRSKGYEAKTRFKSLEKPMDFKWSEFYTRYQEAYEDKCAPLREEAYNLCDKLSEEQVKTKGEAITVAIKTADDPQTLENIVGRLKQMVEDK